MKKCQGCNKKIKNAFTFCDKCIVIETPNEEPKKKLSIEIIVSFK